MTFNIEQIINTLTEYADLDTSEFKKYLIDYAITIAEKERMSDKVDGYITFIMKTRALEYLEAAMSLKEEKGDLPDTKYPHTLQEIGELVESEQSEYPNFYKNNYFKQILGQKLKK